MTDGSPSDALVIFGITGDLAHHKTFPALYRLERHMLLEVPVISSGRTGWSDADLRAQARAQGWPVHDFRSGRRATLIALPTAAGAGAIAGGIAAGVALRRRSRG